MDPAALAVALLLVMSPFLFYSLDVGCDIFKKSLQNVLTACFKLLVYIHTYGPEGQKGDIMSLTTCNQHRIIGYTINGGQYTCRGCGLLPFQHETFAETLARREREAAK